MSRSVSAVYSSRVEAEAVATRLSAMGIDPDHVSIAAEQSGPPGIFDHLARLLVSDAADSAFRLVAEVEPDQAEEAARIVEAGAPGGRLQAPHEITPQTFVFRETAERLVIDKEVAVREEVVMHRSADEHVEVVHDSVRITEVEVERFGPDGQLLSRD